VPADAHTEIAVIGAGAVGLACAAALARRGHGVVVLERHDGPGRETSSRNSGVIHAGLYYEPGSIKAATCVEGRERIYARCARDAVPHRKTGKLVVAVDEAERARLEALAERALANGAGAIEILEREEVEAREPRVRACAALWSPESGIVDAHGLMDSYRAEASAHGATFAFHTRVVGLERETREATDAIWRIETRSDRDERFVLRARAVIDAAGLEADRVAALAGLDVDALGWRQRFCKGDYFSVAPSLGALTRHLVYPLPHAVAGHLGVHVTMDLGGRYVLGPDAEDVGTPRYDVDPDKAPLFGAAVRRYLPDVPDSALTADRAGVRPRLARPGEPPRDFVIAECSALGAPGLVCLIGIESPGLTASEAIAERVAGLLVGG